MKKDKITLKEEAFLREVFQQGGLETSPIGLADRIMANVEVLPKPKVEEPLLPRGLKIFFGIFFSLALFLGIAYGVSSFDPAQASDSPLLTVDYQGMVNVIKGLSGFFTRPGILIGSVAILLLVLLDNRLGMHYRKQQI